MKATLLQQETDRRARNALTQTTDDTTADEDVLHVVF